MSAAAMYGRADSVSAARAVLGAHRAGPDGWCVACEQDLARLSGVPCEVARRAGAALATRRVRSVQG
jgi:hypothetical protein